MNIYIEQIRLKQKRHVHRFRTGIATAEISKVNNNYFCCRVPAQCEF